jgi:hypothetical protein
VESPTTTRKEKQVKRNKVFRSEAPAFPKPTPRTKGERRAKRRTYAEPAPQAFPKPAGRKYDEQFMADARALGCLLRDVPGHVCDGPATFDHMGEHPLGRKSDDNEGAPLCPSAHRERQTATGWCDGLDEFGMRLVMTTAIAETQQRVEQRRAA